MKKRDLLGQQFGRLKVIGEVKTIKGRAMWLCECVCGNKKEIAATHLLRGAVVSCGCYRNEIAKKNISKISYKHGQSKTRLYRKYTSMLSRCNNPNNPYYRLYGKRGIKVCEEWENNFIAFEKWALENGYVDGLSIERIDNDKGYYPDNCKFVPLIQQQNNKSNNVRLCYKNKTKTLAEWSRELNINRSTITQRLKRGWTVEEALTKPVDTKRYRLKRGGQ